MAKRRFSAKQIAAQRAFAARYGGKKSRGSGGKARKVTKMASRTRRYASRARSFGGRSKPLIDGALAGVATPFAANYLGRYGAPAALIGVGMFRKNDTLTTLGAFNLGASLIAGSGVMGTSAMPAGGYL